LDGTHPTGTPATVPCAPAGLSKLPFTTVIGTGVFELAGITVKLATRLRLVVRVKAYLFNELTTLPLSVQLVKA
jgi:hypothetical protein